MSIAIEKTLKIRPGSIAPGEEARLSLELSTNQSPSETASIEYTLSAPGVVFASSGTNTLSTSEEVFSTGTTSVTPFALTGPPGLVSIRAEVTPASPPERSKTSVVLTAAGLVGAPSAAAKPARTKSRTQKRE